MAPSPAFWMRHVLVTGMALVLCLVLAESAQALAVSKGKVYWTKDSDLYGKGAAVGRANVNGTRVRPNFIRLRNRIGDSLNGALATSGSHIYWGVISARGGARGNTGAIGRARLNGRGVQPRLITRINPFGLAAHGRNLYWTNTVVANAESKNASVGRARLNGKRVQRRFIRAGLSADGAADIAVDASGIYWGASYTHDADYPSIARANLKGGNIELYFVRLNRVIRTAFLGAHPGRVIGLDGPSIYYTESVEGTLDERTVQYTTLDPSERHSGRLMEFDSDDAISFAVDGSYLYWVQRLGESRYRLIRAKILRKFSEGVHLYEQLGRRDVIADLRTQGHQVS